MTSSVALDAPAKINWTLEILGKRPDGYHEVRTILQTIRLGDYVELRPASELSLSVRGATRAFRRTSREAPETNLAYRAALRLREHTGVAVGAEIRLSKRIPVAAGLGGGSSDAAAVLRGLRELWQLNILDDDLARLAAELGSDVPFFLLGGTALASGRGDKTEALPQMPSRPLIIAWPRAPRSGDKTARMYDALRPEHYTDGSRTERLVERLRAGEPIRDDDLYNIFETILPEVDPDAAERFERSVALGFGQPHLCGSGPAFFFLLTPEQSAQPLLEALERLNVRAAETHTLSAAEAVVDARRGN